MNFEIKPNTFILEYVVPPGKVMILPEPPLFKGEYPGVEDSMNWRATYVTKIILLTENEILSAESAKDLAPGYPDWALKRIETGYTVIERRKDPKIFLVRPRNVFAVKASQKA